MMISGLSNLVRASTVAAFAALSAVAASASTLPNSLDIDVSASVGNPVTSGDLPQSASISTFGAGNDFSYTSSNLITFTSSGFPQTMTGTVAADITAGQIVLSYSGTAQGVGLTFNLTNIDFGGLIIDSASQSGSTGIISGVNATQSVSFTDNSISGGFSLFGFQPNTNVTQTIAFTTKSAPPPPPPPNVVPLPAGLPLLLAGLGSLWVVRRKKSD